MPNDWQGRHTAAFLDPVTSHERALVFILKGWEEYAEGHEDAYESPIGEDYVLGDDWAKIGFALRGLLNGDLGRLDGGTLDAFICHRLNEAGFDPDMEERKDSR